DHRARAVDVPMAGRVSEVLEDLLGRSIDHALSADDLGHLTPPSAEGRRGTRRPEHFGPSGRGAESMALRLVTLACPRVVGNARFHNAWNPWGIRSMDSVSTRART